MSRRKESSTEKPLTSDDIASLRDEIRLLREILDEVGAELSWANNNAHDLPPGAGAMAAFTRITSMSLDPTARDFQVNTVDEETIARLRDEHAITTTTPTGSSQRSLF
jgi:hypothetical protein